jgi:hypothetical protein
MKTLSCDLCDAKAQGNTFEAWMKNLMPHYQDKHADVMKQHEDNPEAGREAQGKWMEENKKRWDAV